MNFKSSSKISATHPLQVAQGKSGIHGYVGVFELAEPADELLGLNPTYWLQNITNFISF